MTVENGATDVIVPVGIMAVVDTEITGRAIAAILTDGGILLRHLEQAPSSAVQSLVHRGLPYLAHTAMFSGARNATVLTVHRTTHISLAQALERSVIRPTID